jgi:hypothetical protein
MNSAVSTIVLFATLLLAVVIASGATPLETILGQQTISSPVMKSSNDGGKMAATCYDSKLAEIFNRGLASYAHNMSQLANYVLNQIRVARIGGTWFVHAEMIRRHQAHVEWESTSNGDIFQAASRHGCYVNDGATYIVAIKY